MRVTAQPQFVAPCDMPGDQPDVQFSFATDLDLAVNPPLRTVDTSKAAEQLVASTMLSLISVQPMPNPAIDIAETPVGLGLQGLLGDLPPDIDAPLLSSEADSDDLTSSDEEATEAPTDAFVMPAVELPKAAKHEPKGPVATLAVSEPAPLPDNPNPSHVHLVIDDGAERVVITVAVRGSEVNVGLRSNDEQLTAAMARNAATLDHAMHVRGLDLSGFSAERDSHHEREPGEEPDAERKEQR